MKAKITVLSMVMAMLLVAVYAFAVESNKPSSHDISWMDRHGSASKVNKQECLQCHTDQVSCIQCHQEVSPRNHTPSWTKKGHGLEARWDRSSCTTCHKEDSCIECHSVTPPSSHRPGWGGSGASLQRHCNNCHYPVQQTTCNVCHKTAHAPNAY
ncbi:hypothetical protein [Geovibrio ferrireducens]|jgi:hypothetical protein|uniref:hypothetical protein n=1 Tax=Geovibrio ferrireducens TaxID=46201 RepID=UPI0022477671|nr:hypothetical protein [Geovibrio ferrireducens]